MTKRIEKEFKDMTIEEKEAYRNIRFLKLRELHRISEGFRRSIDALIKELDESYLSAKNTGG